MIKVCNKHMHEETEQDIYIARPSVLANPWSHMDSNYPDVIKVGSRKEAVDNYINYFLQQYKNDSSFREIIDDLVELHKNNIDFNLVCWCSPKECHGDVIKKFVEYQVNRSK